MAKKTTAQQIADLQSQIATLQAQSDAHDKKVHRTRYFSHLAFIIAGLLLTTVLVKLDWNPIESSWIIATPSFIMETIDRIRRL